jgi:hypothetical protein
VSLAAQEPNVKNDARDRDINSRHQAILGQTMHNSQPDDFLKLDDPSFLAERARLRGLLAEQSASPADQSGSPADQSADGADRDELQRRYEAMTAEFCRRARIAWTSTS